MDQKLSQRIDQWVEGEKEHMVADLISLVNIKSISTPGAGGYANGIGCARCLDKALEIARGMGLETENDEYYNGSAILKRQTDREIGLVGHLDVVPEGDFGRFEPYNAIVKDGCVIGRGASDNKGAVVMALYVAKCLKELKIPLKHSIRVLMGCSEETGGMDDMKHFVANNKVPDFSLIVDSSFPLHYGEKGIMQADLTISLAGGNIKDFHGGVASNSVPDYAEMTLADVSAEQVKNALGDKASDVTIETVDGSVRLVTRGVAGHAAFPEGSVSATQKLASYVADSGLLAPNCNSAMCFIRDAFADYYGKGLDIDFRDDIFGPTTHVGGMVHMEGDKLYQNINVRFVKKLDEDVMVQQLTECCKKHGFTVENLSKSSAMYIPLESPVVQTLLKTAREMLGRDDLEPFVMGGGTHARALPNAIGFGPGIRGENSPFGSPHGPEEACVLAHLYRAIKVYIEALMRIDDLV